MSDQTLAAVAEAIAAHLADEYDNGSPSLLTDWFVVAAAQPADFDRTRYMTIAPGSTPYHSILGLLRYANLQLAGAFEDPS